MLLVVDVQTGAVEEDALLARRLRRADVPVLVVVNKVDTEREEATSPPSSRSGSGTRSRSRRCTGAGSGDLLDQLVAVLLRRGAPTRPRSRTSRGSRIVGRPNVGKSSLFNRLVGEERSRRVRGGGHDQRTPWTRS